MKSQLEDLVDGRKLSVDEARELVHAVLHDGTSAAHLAAFLTLFRMRGVSVDELDGFAQALLELATPVDLAPHEVLDVCGTGGDNRGTFNISTVTAFVLAGAGYRVAKHGNYAVSSACGSSNVLEELGVPLASDRDTLLRTLERSNVCFIHAPLFHPALKKAAPVRRELGFRTVFNMLGPLINPARPMCQVNGVYDRQVLRLYGAILRRRGIRFAALLSGDGHDEVTLTAPLSVVTNRGEKRLEAEDFSLTPVKAEALLGGATAKDAATIVREILEGRGTREQEDVVAASAALAMHVFHVDKSLSQCVEAARESIRSGRALGALRSTISG